MREYIFHTHVTPDRFPPFYYDDKDANAVNPMYLTRRGTYWAIIEGRGEDLGPLLPWRYQLAFSRVLQGRPCNPTTPAVRAQLSTRGNANAPQQVC